jgi:rod shape-determining protein MreB
VIVDLELARTYLLAVTRKATRHRWRRVRPRAVIGVPAGATPLERRGLLEAAHEAGLRTVALLPEPVAGAIGCGINPLEARAHMVVDIGGGTSEITGFCFGGILTHRTCGVAGDELTTALSHHIRAAHQVVVGELTAEDVKVRMNGIPDPPLIVEGRDAAYKLAILASLAFFVLADAPGGEFLRRSGKGLWPCSPDRLLLAHLSVLSGVPPVGAPFLALSSGIRSDEARRFGVPH